jgi:hypothetical protein
MPGKPDTKKFVAQYGDRLVCVRYRYDAELRCRHTTVEVIGETTPWEPASPRISADTLVLLTVASGEVARGKTIGAAGREWDKQRNVWTLA